MADDMKPTLYWMEVAERSEFFDPFVEILDEADLAASKVSQTGDRPVTCLTIPVGNGLHIGMVVQPEVTAVHLTNQHGKLWFPMELNTTQQSDFIGWLSMVKGALRQLPRGGALDIAISATLDAAQVRATGVVPEPVSILGV